MRLKHKQPILFLTGETSPEIKLSGLDLGVDDFLHKPITTAELTAYLNNRIRAHRQYNPVKVSIGNLEINLADTQVSLEGKPIT